MTQSASDYSVGTINQDGAELGLRTGIAIDTDGNVVASFSNGLTQNLARIPIATFTNPNGLQERTGNVYIRPNSAASGRPRGPVRTPRRAGARHGPRSRDPC